MTETIRNTWINYFQCKQAANLVTLNKAIGLGICAKKNIRKNNILSCLIDIITGYQVFEEEVTYAYSFEIVLEASAVDVDTTITINGTDYTSTGRDDLDTILDDLQTALAADFETLVKDQILYIWSFNGSYNSTTSTSTTITTDNTITSENITDDPDVILDQINCLDSDEICNIIKYTKKLINTKCNC